MINSVNSYSSYYNNYTSNNENSKTKILNNNSNLVNDKTQAVNKILGYGVDKDGYFTSDFNEAAGLPKDYKIYAKDAENFVNWEIGDRFFYSTQYSVDFAKTIGNTYKVFSQLIPKTPILSFSQEDLQNIPYGFIIDKNYNITQTFSKDEYEKAINSTQTNRINLTFNVFGDKGFENINIDSIFNQNNGDVRLSKKAYVNSDGTINKGGVLMALLNSQMYGATGALLEGETKIFGKITYDKNISEVERKNFLNFMNANKIQSAFFTLDSVDLEWNIIEERLSMQLYIKRSQNVRNLELTQQANDFAKEYEELINSNISLDKFKEKYLDFKQRHDEFVKKLEEAENNTALNQNKNNEINLSQSKNKFQNNNQENLDKTFTPIQGESKNKETYKDNNIRNELLKKLLENRFDTRKQLELLFEIKFNDDKAYNEFNQLFSQIRLNNNNVDLRI